MADILLANRIRQRGCSDTGRADLDPAARAPPAPHRRSAVAAAHGGTCAHQRFSTAGELTASIAHEINQPLGSILANAETAQSMLLSSHPDIEELKDIV